MSLILDGTNGLSDVDGSAATPAIRGSDANTGIFFPGADRIGFAEGGVQVGEFDASGNFLMNSGYGSAAVAYGCRAWVNFDGTTSPGTIQASGNVSSVTRENTGRYIVNLTTAMPDASYSVVCGGVNTDGATATTGNNRAIFNTHFLGTSSFKVSCVLASSTSLALDNCSICNISVFR